MNGMLDSKKKTVRPARVSRTKEYFSSSINRECYIRVTRDINDVPYWFTAYTIIPSNNEIMFHTNVTMKTRQPIAGVEGAEKTSLASGIVQFIDIKYVKNEFNKLIHNNTETYLKRHDNDLLLSEVKKISFRKKVINRLLSNENYKPFFDSLNEYFIKTDKGYIVTYEN